MDKFLSVDACPSRHQLIEVEAGSAADKAGLKSGDFLLQVSSFILRSVVACDL